MTALSVLDLVPVRSDQTSSDAIAATLALARAADDLGFTRYWVAEHHNMPAVAATNPLVLMALVGSATRRIRVGSGGVMLPNHAPLVVAEQVALLEAAFPGRVDLGIGRAPGSDPVTSYMLRRGVGRDDTVDTFPDDIATVTGLVGPGVSLALGHERYTLSATPRPASVPTIWLLGSSMYSAQLAAASGLPYVFANHFGSGGTSEALATYRSQFRPSDVLDAPRTIAVVNAVVAETADEARRLVLPNQRSMYRLRTGGRHLGPQELVEEAEAAPLDDAAQRQAEALAARWVVGTPTQAAAQVRALADELRTDEVMLAPVAGAFEGTDPASAPAREATLRLLAGELL